jgi:hypothetical protein
MLAADVAECVVDPEPLGSVGEESQDIQTANCQIASCWLQPDIWVCALPVVDFIPTEDAVTEDAVTSVTDPDIGEPVTDPADGQGLPEGFSLTVQPVTCVFEPTGMIAVDPQVIVDPVIGEGLIVGDGLLVQQNVIDETVTLVDTTPVDTSGSLDPSTDPVPTDEQAVDGDDTAVIEKVVIEPWFRTVVIEPWFRTLGDSGDPVVCVYDGPIFWCAASATVAAEQAFIAESPIESPAADSTADDEAPVVASSSGGLSPSTATSAATAQAFATFAASFGQGTSSGQGGGDVQSGHPFIGDRRTARRSVR